MGYLKLSALGVFLVLGIEIGIRHGASALECSVPPFAANLTQDTFLTCLTASCRYDKYVIPESSTPLNITVRVDVKYLEVMHTQFTAYLTVQLMYEDSKLNYENLTTNRVIFGDEDVKDKIWTPHIEMNDQSGTTIIETKQEDIRVSINQRGLVIYSYKMAVKFYCSMDLKKFPFDTQKCTLSFSDWSYDNSQLKLHWNSFSPSVFATDFQFTEFVIDEVEYTDGNNDGPYEINTLSSSVGDFSELGISFKFHRDIGYYLVDFFLPSYLLVCTAWVTFWLQADAGPPRATLGASTVVAFLTLHLALSKDIPKVSYIKASDIWFLGVSCFIFFSLAEFAFVNVIWRRKKIVELKKPNPKYILKSALMPSKSRENLRRIESQVSLTNSLNSLKTVRSENNLLDSSNSRSRKTSQVTLKIDEALNSIPEKNESRNWTKSHEDLRHHEPHMMVTKSSNGLKSVKSETNLLDCSNSRSRKTSQVTLKIDEALNSIPETDETQKTAEVDWTKLREDLKQYESQGTLINSSNGLKPVKSENNLLECSTTSRSRKTSQVKIDETLNSIPEKEEIPEAPEFFWTTMSPQEVATYIDRKARIIFPICFLLFNVVYWSYVYF